MASLCARVGLSRQAFYHQRRDRQRRQIDGDAVVEQVKAERKRQPRLGVRKLHFTLGPELERMGIRMGRDRFFELLRERGMLVKRRRRGAKTTNSRHGFHTWPNLVRHVEPSMVNQVWVSDLTYIRTEGGFLYLSLVMDVYSRKIVGHWSSESLSAEGCMKALRMALAGAPEACPIHHSDRGLQYCCSDYIDLLQRRGCAISMTEVNHCYENAKAERLNGILKDEYGLGMTFKTKRHATDAIQQAILLYNCFRPHTCLKYKTPEAVYAAA